MMFRVNGVLMDSRQVRREKRSADEQAIGGNVAAVQRYLAAKKGSKQEQARLAKYRDVSETLKERHAAALQEPDGPEGLPRVYSGKDECRFLK